MSAFLATLSREFRAYFFSPLAYIVMAVLLLVNGFIFWLIVSFLSDPRAAVGAPLELFFGQPWHDTGAVEIFESAVSSICCRWIFPWPTMADFSELGLLCASGRVGRLSPRKTRWIRDFSGCIPPLLRSFCPFCSVVA